MNILKDRELKIALIFFVLFYIIVSVIIYSNVYGFQKQFLFVSGLMFLMNIASILMFKYSRIWGLLSSLFSFIMCIVLQYLVAGIYLVWNTKIAIFFVACFLYSIYHEIEYNRENKNLI